MLSALSSTSPACHDAFPVFKDAASISMLLLWSRSAECRLEFLKMLRKQRRKLTGGFPPLAKAAAASMFAVRIRSLRRCRTLASSWYPEDKDA